VEAGAQTDVPDVPPGSVRVEASLRPEPPVEPDGPAPIPLVEPRDGVPEPITTPAQLAAACAALAAGSGPVAVDAERASGFRYGQKAYLVQLRRQGAGTLLVDPVPLSGLGELGTAIQDAEWVLHAASQDLPCLLEQGMHPTTIFDTELAGRLLGYARVGLGPIVAEVLGFALEKGHSAADWSTRPLPESWLRYAALDVEVLLELRDALERELVEAGKIEWAREEFAAIVAAPPAAARVEPWRRTSGLHRVRRPRQLAAVRALWEARDQLARRRDTAPGRILPDAAIVEAALAMPRTEAELIALPVFGGRQTRRLAGTWFAAVDQARALPDADLPAPTATTEGPPPARGWADRDPAAAARLSAARAAVAAIADEHHLPTENLLSPDTIRRLCWQPPERVDEESVAEFLRSHGARGWQVRLTTAALLGALARVSARL
jgi:ribonuclease D